MSEILFIVEEAEEGGHVVHAVGASIVTEADDLAQRRTMVREAVRCHHDEDDAGCPKAIPAPSRPRRSHRGMTSG